MLTPKIKNVAQQVAKHAPNSTIMVATNPVDIMTYVAYKATCFPRNRILGIGSVFDSIHFRDCIAKELSVSRKDVNAMVIGEHGQTMMPLIEYANVSGIPITSLLTPEKIEKAISQTATSKINQWSAAHASTIVMITNAIIKGKSFVASVSTPLKGEYSYSDIAIGIPAVLGKNGIQKIVELKLSDKDKKRFENSIQVVKAALYSIRFDG